MSRCKSPAVCVIAGLLISTAAPSMACGDKLVALGGGVRFERVVVSRHPGRILLVLSPGSGLAEANSRFNLASALALAGHAVVEIDDPSKLDDQLTAEPVDLILVDASDFQGIALHSRATGQGPAIMPVKFRDEPPAHASAGWAPDCIADAGERKGKTLLRTVEKTLDLRSRGLSGACYGGPGNSSA
jgi:hypothetical protein